MSIKRFCDRCESEVTLRNYVLPRYRPVLGEFKLEVMVSRNGTSNSGEICFVCLVEVFNDGAEDLEATT